MLQKTPVWRKIDQQLMSAPLDQGEQTVQLVAQQCGWQLAISHPNGQVMGAWVRIQPTLILVRKGGVEQQIPIVDSIGLMQNALFLIALAIPALCWLSLLIARRVAAPKVETYQTRS